MNFIFSFVLILILAVSSIFVFHPEQYVFSLLKQKNTVPALTTLHQNFSLPEHIARGDAYLKQGFTDLAFNEYVAAQKQDSNSDVVYRKIATINLLTNNPEGAMTNMERAVTISQSLENNLLLAKAYIANKKWIEAEAILSNISGQSDEGDYYGQVLSILKEENINSRQTIVHSDTLKKSQNLAQAFDTFKLEQGGQKVYLKALIAKALISNEDYTLAEKILLQILKERSNYRDSWIMLGYTSLQLQNFPQAEKAFQTAYDLDSTRPEVQFFLGVTAESLGNKQKALQFYELAYKNQYTPRVHVIQKLAEIALELGQYKESLLYYEALLKEKRDSVDLFVRPISLALLQLHDTAKAESLARWAQSTYPNEAQTYNLLAWVALEKKDYTSAKKYLEKTFSINKTFAPAYYNQGLLHEAEGDMNAALKSFEIAYNLDKNGSIGGLALEAYNRLSK